MPGSSHRQPSAQPSAQPPDPILAECDKALTRLSELIAFTNELDTLHVLITDFHGKIGMIVEAMGDNANMSYLKEELQHLQLLLLAYKNVPGYSQWINNRDVIDQLYSDGVIWERMVRDRVQAGYPPEPDHLQFMRTFIKQAKKLQFYVLQGSNAKYVSTLQEGSRILNKQWGKFKRAFGNEDAEAQLRGVLKNIRDGDLTRQNCIQVVQQMRIDLVAEARASPQISHIFDV